MCTRFGVPTAMTLVDSCKWLGMATDCPTMTGKSVLEKRALMRTRVNEKQ